MSFALRRFLLWFGPSCEMFLPKRSLMAMPGAVCTPSMLGATLDKESVLRISTGMGTMI